MNPALQAAGQALMHQPRLAEPSFPPSLDPAPLAPHSWPSHIGLLLLPQLRSEGLVLPFPFTHPVPVTQETHRASFHPRAFAHVALALELFPLQFPRLALTVIQVKVLLREAFSDYALGEREPSFTALSKKVAR